MSDLSRFHPVGGSSWRADIYARYRPGYPSAAIDYILARCGLGARSLLIDIGCGTGIASRLFAGRGIAVIGIEPSAEMRGQAESETVPAGLPAPSYRQGRAEATGLPDGVADAVFAAQAFHWFQPAAALAEFHRVLKPDGWSVLIWNERAEADPLTAAYGRVVRSSASAAAIEGSRAGAGDALLVSPLFHGGERRVFVNEQEVDEEGLLGRAFSTSYAPRAPAQAEAFAAALRDVFARYQRHGKVVIRYETTVYSALRAVRTL